MRKEICVAVDLSMRSTGIVSLTRENKLLDFKIIASKLNDEELLIWNANEIVKFVRKAKPSFIVFEGLSFMSKSAHIDKIYGNMWVARCALRREFGENLRIGVIPVLSWRNSLLTKEERKNAKEFGKEGIKLATVDKLPKIVRNRFKKYVKKNKLSKKAIFDLTDAWGLGVFRNSL